MNTTKRNNLVRAALAQAYPDTAFAVEAMQPSRRNGRNKLAIGWEGGPLADAVQELVRDVPGCMFLPIGYSRRQTREELDAWFAEYEAGEPARQAAREAEKVANKAAGIAKRAETVRAKATLQETLAATFPGVTFSITSEGRYGWLRVVYTGGPSTIEVEAAGRCLATRHASAEEIAAKRVEADRRERDEARMLRQLEALGHDPDEFHYLGHEGLRREWKRITGKARRLRRLLAVLQGQRYQLRTRRVRPVPPQLVLPMPLPVWLSGLPKQRSATRFN